MALGLQPYRGHPQGQRGTRSREMPAATGGRASGVPRGSFPSLLAHIELPALVGPQFVLLTAFLFSGPVSRAFRCRRCGVLSTRCPDTSLGLGTLPLSSLPRGHVHCSCSLLPHTWAPGGVGLRGCPPEVSPRGPQGRASRSTSIYKVDGVGQRCKLFFFP